MKERFSDNHLIATIAKRGQMILMEWEDRLMVNIKAFDDQHKKLIALINKLYDAMTAGRGKKALEDILSELVTYTITHFANEQALFQKHGYPDLVQHKKEHDELTKKAIELRDGLNSDKEVIGVEVMSFLKDWLRKHILGTDKKYTVYLNGKGIY